MSDVHDEVRHFDGYFDLYMYKYHPKVGLIFENLYDLFHLVLFGSQGFIQVRGLSIFIQIQRS